MLAGQTAPFKLTLASTGSSSAHAGLPSTARHTLLPSASTSTECTTGISILYSA
jgi:hypothetical protein